MESTHQLDLSFFDELQEGTDLYVLKGKHDK
jgi:hypothetical protein